MRLIFATFALLTLLSCNKDPEVTPEPPEPEIQLSSKEKLKASLGQTNNLKISPTNPITYTLRASDTQSAIADGVWTRANDSLFYYSNVRSVLPRVGLNGFVTPQSTDYGNSQTKVINANVSSVEFIFTGTEFEILMFGFGGVSAKGNMHITVDGDLTNEEGYPSPSATDGQRHYINVKFSTPATKKRIKITYSGLKLFGGIITNKDDKIEKYKAPVNARVIIFGDSYTAGTGAQFQFTKFYAYRLGQLLGFDNAIISGVGGTGYLNPNRTDNRKNFIARIDDIIDANPDAVIIAGGINDRREGTAKEVGDAALSFFQAIRTALPNTEIFVVGPWHPSGSAYPVDYAAAIKDASAKVSSSHFIDTNGYFTGTGNIGTPNGSGNTDEYIDTDAVHPTIAGHNYIANKLSVAISDIISKL